VKKKKASYKGQLQNNTCLPSLQPQFLTLPLKKFDNLSNNQYHFISPKIIFCFVLFKKKNI